ncbi:hypothetical protein CCMA1212_004794 [Trichoderma ghanense]|uniref:Uncharacterized protein n=1 Tax=Trichoderma ghanense TaxID=65468 RepID=A0ABY2H5W2_9HYPO
MCELVHCPGCGELISESLPISECLTCLSSYPRERLPERSASAPPSAGQTEITLYIFIIRNNELVSVSDYAVQSSGRSGRDRS